MKITALKSLSKEELANKKIELMQGRLELLVLKKNQELKKTHRLRMIRQQIAQINTLLSIQI